METQAKSYLLSDPVIKKKEEARLTEQAQLLFEIEMNGVEKYINSHELCIIDLGAGNGAYLDCFTKIFPNVKKIGVDRSQFLLDQGKLSRPSIDYIQSDLLNFVKTGAVVPKNGLIVLRFVLQHLSPGYLSSLLESARTTFAGQKILIIDVDDNKFQDGGDASLKALHQNLVDKQHKNGGNRTIAQELPSILDSLKLKPLFAKDIVYSAETIGAENFRNIFLQLLFINATEELSTEQKEKLAKVSNVSFFARLELVQA